MASETVKQTSEFTADELKYAFERIAVMADTAGNALAESDQCSAGLVLDLIGALADHMAGETVKGSVARWACGPRPTTCAG